MKIILILISLSLIGFDSIASLSRGSGNNTVTCKERANNYFSCFIEKMVSKICYSNIEELITLNYDDGTQALQTLNSIYLVCDLDTFEKLCFEDREAQKIKKDFQLTGQERIVKILASKRNCPSYNGRLVK